MEKLKEISEMTDEQLYKAAVDAYKSIKTPSSNLKFLYEVWFGENRLHKIKVQRVHSETIYKLSLFEKDAIGEEVQ